MHSGMQSQKYAFEIAPNQRDTHFKMHSHKYLFQTDMEKLSVENMRKIMHKIRCIQKCTKHWGVWQICVMKHKNKYALQNAQW